MTRAAFALCCLLQVFHANARLELIYNYDVESIDGSKAQLLCKIDSDKAVKEVIWYRLYDAAPKQVVYYLEPSRINTSAPAYQNRVRLAQDQSSLVFYSVAKDDEGLYECQVKVLSNNSKQQNEIPEEARQSMKLTVNIPPKSVKLTSFTSNKNMTLTCRSSGSKPETDIFWLVKRRNEVRELRSAKIITEYQGDLADTIGYFYISLSPKDKGTTIFCVVNHPQTDTSLRDNVTMVAPSLPHSVMMYFDWLGGEVPYSEYDASSKDGERLGGLVEMEVIPSLKVEENTTVRVTITSKGSFPEPRYTWWSEDLDLRSGRVIRVDSIKRNQQLFCLVENPVGRVVVSVQLTVAGADAEDAVVDPSARPVVAISGVMIMGIVFGTLVLVLVAAFLVYYCAFKPANEKEKKKNGDEGKDFDPYVEKQKLPDAAGPPTGQVKESSCHIEPELHSSNEKQALLKSAFELTPPVKYRKAEHMSGRTSSTSTSGYGGDLGGSNGVEDNRRSPSDGKKRAISQHLLDFDENASFVGDYGSSFGLDATSEHNNSRRKQQESDSDNGSYDSGTSGVEGRYTFPPSGSWENIDPSQVVAPQHQATDI